MGDAGVRVARIRMPGCGCPRVDADTSSSCRTACWCWVPLAGTTSWVSSACRALPPGLASAGVPTFGWARQEEGTPDGTTCRCHLQQYWQPRAGASGCPVSAGSHPGVPQVSCTWWRWTPSSAASTASPCCGRSARGAPRSSRRTWTMGTGTGVSGGRWTAWPHSQLTWGMTGVTSAHLPAGYSVAVGEFDDDPKTKGMARQVQRTGPHVGGGGARPWAPPGLQGALPRALGHGLCQLRSPACLCAPVPTPVLGGISVPTPVPGVPLCPCAHPSAGATSVPPCPPLCQEGTPMPTQVPWWGHSGFSSPAEFVVGVPDKSNTRGEVSGAERPLPGCVGMPGGGDTAMAGHPGVGPRDGYRDRA